MRYDDIVLYKDLIEDFFFILTSQNIIFNSAFIYDETIENEERIDFKYDNSTIDNFTHSLDDFIWNSKEIFEEYLATYLSYAIQNLDYYNTFKLIVDRGKVFQNTKISIYEFIGMNVYLWSFLEHNEDNCMDKLNTVLSEINNNNTKFFIQNNIFCHQNNYKAFLKTLKVNRDAVAHSIPKYQDLLPKTLLLKDIVYIYFFKEMGIDINKIDINSRRFKASIVDKLVDIKRAIIDIILYSVIGNDFSPIGFINSNTINKKIPSNIDYNEKNNDNIIKLFNFIIESNENKKNIYIKIEDGANTLKVNNHLKIFKVAIFYDTNNQVRLSLRSNILTNEINFTLKNLSEENIQDINKLLDKGLEILDQEFNIDNTFPNVSNKNSKKSYENKKESYKYQQEADILNKFKSIIP